MCPEPHIYTVGGHLGDLQFPGSTVQGVLLPCKLRTRLPAVESSSVRHVRNCTQIAYQQEQSTLPTSPATPIF